jgi:hypothetical protein
LISLTNILVEKFNSSLHGQSLRSTKSEAKGQNTFPAFVHTGIDVGE